MANNTITSNITNSCFILNSIDTIKIDNLLIQDKTISNTNLFKIKNSKNIFIKNVTIKNTKMLNSTIF